MQLTSIISLETTADLRACNDFLTQFASEFSTMFTQALGRPDLQYSCKLSTKPVKHLTTGATTSTSAAAVRSPLTDFLDTSKRHGASTSFEHENNQEQEQDSLEIAHGRPHRTWSTEYEEEEHIHLKSNKSSWESFKHVVKSTLLSPRLSSSTQHSVSEME